MAFAQMVFYSNTLGMDIPCTILLPEKRRSITSDWKEQKFPVLYLLHGHGEGHDAWIRKSNIEIQTRNLPLIIVMPTTHRGFYSNNKNGLKYFDFIANELPIIIENYFPVSKAKENHFIAGNSMGGYGALKIALTYPERFQAAASFSGALDPYEIIKDKKIADLMGKEFRAYLDNIYGSQNEFNNSNNSIRYLLEKKKVNLNECPKIYQCCGTEDILTYSINKMFNTLLLANYPSTNYQYSESSGGHDFNYWNKKITDMLVYFGLKSKGEV